MGEKRVLVFTAAVLVAIVALIAVYVPDPLSLPRDIVHGDGPNPMDFVPARAPRSLCLAEPPSTLPEGVTCPGDENGSSGGDLPRVGAIIKFHEQLTRWLLPTGQNDAPALEVLVDGMMWAEGPLVDPSSGSVLLSDIYRNSVLWWHGAEDEAHTCGVLLCPSGLDAHTNLKEPGTNGLAWEPETGNLVMCDHGNRGMHRIELDHTPAGPRVTQRSTRDVLADKYFGDRLNSPNDVVFAANGDMYFTDPPYGLQRLRQPWVNTVAPEDEPEMELERAGVYLMRRVPGTGDLSKPRYEDAVLVVDTLSRPNGIELSPDGRTLYVGCSSTSEDAGWWAFALAADGSVMDEGRRFGNFQYIKEVVRLTLEAHRYPGPALEPLGNTDGMAVASDGTVFATGPGGVEVLSPAGTLLGFIATGAKTGNVALDEARGWLYIAAHTRLLRVRLADASQRGE